MERLDTIASKPLLPLATLAFDENDGKPDLEIAMERSSTIQRYT